MRALRRVLRVPGLWLGLCALHLALAWGLALPVAGAVRTVMGGRVWTDPHRLIAALAELLAQSPAIVAVFATATIASGLLGAAIALLVRGGALLRLDDASDRSTRAWAEFGRASLGNLPVLALIGLYGLVLRLVLSFVTNVLAASHALVELVVLILVLTFATCVGDLAAARRVLRGERGVHPREYVRACIDVAKSPLLWLSSGALTLARWAVAAAIVLVAVHGAGEAWASWSARGLACVAVFLALWRMAVAVEASRRA